MADTKLAVYTAGQGRLIPVNHTGPASYVTNGETLGNYNSQTGVTYLGLAEIDWIDCGSSLSGNYFVYAIPVNQKQFTLVWVTASNGIPTGTQVSNGTNLSGETVRMVVVGR